MNQTQVFYDNRVSSKYKTSVPLKFSAPYQEAYKHIKSYAKPGMKILDLGCGTGMHLHFFQSLQLEVTGVDLSAKSLEICKNQLDRPNSVTLVNSDIESFLKDQKDSYDIIFISGTLYYLNLDSTIQQVQNILRPNGIFICVDTNGDNFILNFYRRCKALLFKHRDAQTQNNLLTIKKLERSLFSIFPNTSIQYFDFLTMYFSIISSQRHIYKFLAAIDRYIFTTTFFKKLCFKFVTVSKKGNC